MRVFAFFYYVILLSSSALAQSGDVLVKQIQKKYQAIDLFSKTANFRSEHFQDEASKEFELVIFTANEQPLKLQVKLGNDLEMAEKAYYFDGPELIFIKKRKTTFPRPPRWEEAKSEELGEEEKRAANSRKIEIDHFYFKSGEMIQWTSGSSILEMDNAFWVMEKNLIQEVENLLLRISE